MGEWFKEHWKLVVTIVVAVIAVVALVVITVVTAGAALGPILTGVLVHNLDCHWDPRADKIHGNLPSKRELDKLQPKQLNKLAEQLRKSIETRRAENNDLGDSNGGLYGYEARIDTETEVLDYINELLEDFG